MCCTLVLQLHTQQPCFAFDIAHVQSPVLLNMQLLTSFTLAICCAIAVEVPAGLAAWRNARGQRRCKRQTTKVDINNDNDNVNNTYTPNDSTTNTNNSNTNTSTSNTSNATKKRTLQSPARTGELFI